MYIISGSARTGTSMMMQTLVNLNIKTPAKPFIDEHSDILDKNPKGFYEMYEEVINGIQHDKYKGQAVKLFPGCLIQTPKNLISKLVIMKRDRDSALKSYEPIREILKEEMSGGDIYDVNYLILNDYIVDVDHIFINFEEIVSNPEVEIARLVEFLKIEPTKQQFLNAVNNIDTWH
jgi:hypothetical protein